MNSNNGKGKAFSVSTVFLLVVMGFFGFLIIEDIVDEVEVEGATLTVGQAGSGAQYSKIQYAIDNASVGDTVRVWAGTYYEHVQIYKALTLVGNGTIYSIINGSGFGSVVVISASWVNVTGFTMTGSGSSEVPGEEDSGINLDNVSNCHIFDNTLYNNFYGMHLEGSNNRIENCNCSSNGYKGIVLFTNSDFNIFSNNTCNSNSGIGMEVYYSDGNQISNSSFNSNSGGISLTGSNGNIIDSCMGNNNSWYGIFFDHSTNNVIERCNFSLNDKHGIHLRSSSNFNVIGNSTCDMNGQHGINLNLSSNGNSIHDNTCDSNDGYGIIIDSSSSNVIENNILSRNLCGIHLDNTLTPNKIYHNNIISNTQQAFDNVGNNFWNNSQQEGNYWSDYTGQDNGANGRTAGDGIGDTQIPHLSLDNYPFINPFGWFLPGIPILTDPGDYVPDGEYSLTWSTAIDAIGYTLQEDDTTMFDSPSILFMGPNLNFNIMERQNGTYYYRVNAYNDYGNGNWSNTVDMVVDWPPDSPQGLLASVYPEGNTLNITWTPNLVDTKEYDLLYKTAGNWVMLDVIQHPESVYNHTDLIDGETYYYKLKARDHINQESNFTEAISATPSDTSPPPPPKGLYLYDITLNSISMGWQASPLSDEESYNIYRGTTENPTNWGDPINGNSPLTSITHIDTVLDENTVYYYVVTALDEVPNESDFSEVVSASTLISNHPPELFKPRDTLEIFEDHYDDKTINLNQWFTDLDGDALEFRSEGQEHINVTIFQNNGTVALKPEKNWNGAEEIRFYASDNHEEISYLTHVNITGVNDPPDPPEILSPTNGSTFNENQSTIFEATGYDPDVVYGDSLTYHWLSDKMGVIGSGKILYNVRLTGGSHWISVVVKDLENESSVSAIKVIVRPSNQDDDQPIEPIENDTTKPDDPGNETEPKKETEEKEEGSSNVGAIVAVIVILLAVVIFFFFVRPRIWKVEEKEVSTEMKKPDMSSKPPPVALTSLQKVPRDTSLSYQRQREAQKKSALRINEEMVRPER